ncbi:MAG: hypothetical protein H5U21_07870, partial [Porphyrobacter sp.]|nr:hypothetical protein [Porphyrobacter sp.]
MRTLTLALAAAGTMLTTPALARDGQPYLGIEAGAVFPESFDYDLEGTPALVTPGDDDGRPFVFEVPFFTAVAIESFAKLRPELISGVGARLEAHRETKEAF